MKAKKLSSANGHSFLLYFLIEVHYILPPGYLLSFSKVFYIQYFHNMLVENGKSIAFKIFFPKAETWFTHILNHLPSTIVLGEKTWKIDIFTDLGQNFVPVKMYRTNW